MRAVTGVPRRPIRHVIGALVLAALVARPAPRVRAREAEPASDDALATLCGIVETSARDRGAADRLLHPAHLARERVPARRRQPGRRAGHRPVHARHGLRARARRSVRSGVGDPRFGEAAGRILRGGSAIWALRRPPITRVRTRSRTGSPAPASLPFETQDYVLAITGHDVEDWRGDKPPPPPLRLSRSSLCLAVVASWPRARRRRPRRSISGLFAPWGVQVAGSFSKAAALRAFARAQRAMTASSAAWLPSFSARA